MNFILDLIKNISKKLNESSDQKAWWLVEAITKKNKSQLLIDKDFKLNKDQEQILDSWINQYVNDHKPLQYIIGHVPFLDLDILVEPPILIPRPETEAWCFEIINKLKSLKNKKIKILDIGTGSGCIALSFAKYLIEAEAYAVDISDKALELAQKNLKHNKINNVKLIKSDLFESLNDQKFDLIVSNPPYIDKNLFNELDPSVKNWEDKKALICDDGGLNIIKKIIAQTKNFLNINVEFEEKQLPQLIIEIDHTQGKKVIELLESNNFKDIKLWQDIYKKDRVVSARR